MRSERISRRRFLIDSLAALGTTVLGGSILLVRERESKLDWLEYPEDWNYTTKKPLPNALNGAHIATPFLYTTSSEIAEQHLNLLGNSLKSATIFIDDRFESSLGIYEEGVLKKVKDYADLLDRRGMDIVISLFDCYTMRQTWNPFYGAQDATSPYAVNGEVEFFRNNNLKEHFINRLRKIGKSLNGIPNLAAVAIANEPIPPRFAPFDESFINWFNQMVGVVKEKLPDVSVLPGVADPYYITNEIKGLDANTAHVYLHNPKSVLNAIQYAGKGNLPLFIHEFGVAEEILGRSLPPDTDKIMSQLAKEILLGACDTDIKRREVSLGITSLTFWKRDHYKDGFDFDAVDYPKTYQIAKVLDTVSAKL